MKISTRGRYALRLMIDIAEHAENGLVPLKDVAGRQEISTKYLEQITGLLVKAGFLKSERGAQGGYKLAREPKEYSVGSILRLTEGNLAPVTCLEDDENNCVRCETCKTLVFWQGLYNVINEYMESYTLADLINVKSCKNVV